MSCNEHTCMDCGEMWFDNIPRWQKCNHCGKSNVSSQFDEFDTLPLRGGDHEDSDTDDDGDGGDED